MVNLLLVYFIASLCFIWETFFPLLLFIWYKKVSSNFTGLKSVFKSFPWTLPAKQFTRRYLAGARRGIVSLMDNAPVQFHKPFLATSFFPLQQLILPPRSHSWFHLLSSPSYWQPSLPIPQVASYERFQWIEVSFTSAVELASNCT